ncbi:MAG: FAD-dependent oxidoreductase [Deltaproteobacteria bacterium]|nr:FAD-dependent oxidoreductase [Deltaproteobacteria bacterium]
MKTKAEQRDKDVLIIGGGPAGIQASRLIKKSQPDWKVAVIRPEEHSMVYCAIPYAIEGLFPLERTFKGDDLVTGSGAELIRGTVRSVNAAGHRVEMEDGEALTYKKLLIASGATPIRPPLPGINAKNVYTVKTESSARKIIEHLSTSAERDALTSFSRQPEKKQKAVVVGSGAIGIEQATAYLAHGLEVHLIEMQGHVLPNLVDDDMAEPVFKELERLGVNLYLNTRLESLEGGDTIERVRLSGDEVIFLDPARDFVVLSVGMAPDIEFLGAREFERAPDGLVVDEHMRTNVPDVWAAGDCASYRSGVDGGPLGGKLATNAVPMAKVAAKDMLGVEASYSGFFNGAATVVGNLRVGGTGFTETFARSRNMEVFSTTAATTARFPMMPDAGQVEVKLVFEVGSERLVGAQVVGTQAIAERIDLLTFAIQKRATASDLAELSYSAQPWQTFFPARNAIVEASMAACSQKG